MKIEMENSNGKIITLSVLVFFVYLVISCFISGLEKKPSIQNPCISLKDINESECISDYKKILGEDEFYFCGSSEYSIRYPSIMLFDDSETVVGEWEQAEKILPGSFCVKIDLYHKLTYRNYSLLMMYEHQYYPLLEIPIE